MTLAHSAPLASPSAIDRLADVVGELAKLWRRLVARPARIATARPVPADLPGGSAAIRMAATPMTLVEQWQRAVRPLEAATQHAHAMRELHAAAERQLQSVDYALEQLVDDLSDIVTLPRQRLATVHALKPIGTVQFSDAPARPAAAMAA